MNEAALATTRETRTSVVISGLDEIRSLAAQIESRLQNMKGRLHGQHEDAPKAPIAEEVEPERCAFDLIDYRMGQLTQQLSEILRHVGDLEAT